MVIKSRNLQLELNQDRVAGPQVVPELCGHY